MSIEIFNSPEALIHRAAQLFARQVSQAVAQRGQFSVALAGGKTPQALYEHLATLALPWQQMHFFWSDERCVGPLEAGSNYGMAFKAWLSRVPIPAENIHRILGELPPQQAAERYENELRSFFGKQPRFDLALLGMGEDGHTASLFPGSSALQETQAWVVCVPHDTPPPPLVTRVTLTFTALNACRLALFLVSGKGKAPRLAEIRRGESGLPAEKVQPPKGKLLWLVDSAAAGGES